MRVSFGAYVFDSRLRTVTHAGQPVVLSPKAFALLEILLAARPAPVSKETLYERLWPNTFVEQGNLHNLISEIRRAFGDGQRDAIRTVHGFGYAFEAKAASTAAASRFGILRGKELLRLHDGENIVGRDPDAAIVLPSSDISRHHARLVVSGFMVTLEDLGSKNGTFLRGERLTQPAEVHNGDVITVGKSLLVVQELDEPGETETTE